MVYICHLCLFADGFFSMWAKDGRKRRAVKKETQWSGETHCLTIWTVGVVLDYVYILYFFTIENKFNINIFNRF